MPTTNTSSRELPTIKTRSYQLQGAPIKLPSLLPITVGYITFEEDFLDGTETFEEYRDRILAYGSLLSELNIDPEDVEWNGVNGWTFYSDDPVVINEYAVLHDGDVVEADDIHEGFFMSAAVDEVLSHPRQYPKGLVAEELARSELGHYVVHYDEQNGAGYFRRLEEVEPQEVRASAEGAVNEVLADPWAERDKADEVDGSDY